MSMRFLLACTLSFLALSIQAEELKQRSRLKRTLAPGGATNTSHCAAHSRTD